jgi:hypothetical protein
MRSKALKVKFNNVFSQPVRTLQMDELLRVAGGCKNSGGVDNHSKDMCAREH